MEVFVIKIKNTTDNAIDMNVYNDFTFGAEVETEVKEMNFLFEGIKIVTNSGCKVDSCFYDKTLKVNGVEIYVPEWFSLSQLTNDFANIKLIVDYFESIVFKLNPRKRIEFYIPLSKCKFKLYQKTNNELKQKTT